MLQCDLLYLSVINVISNKLCLKPTAFLLYAINLYNYNSRFIKMYYKQLQYNYSTDFITILDFNFINLLFYRPKF